MFIFSCDLPREIDISSYQLETKIEKYKEPKLNLYLILSKNLDLLQTYDGVDGDIHLILGVNKSGIIKHIRTYADIFLNKGISINMTYDQFVEKK